MRKITLLFAVALLAFTSQHALAQARTSMTAQPVKAAAYGGYNDNALKKRAFAVGKEYIYFVEMNKNNALRSINRNTGEVGTVIPGIANVYEDARPRIDGVHECGGRLLFSLEKGGVCVWDGKSVETSPVIKDSWDFKAVGDRYVLLETRSGLKSFYALWDIEQLRPAGVFKQEVFHDRKEVFIACDGTVWMYDCDVNTFGDFGVTKVTPDGNSSFIDVSQDEYIVKNRTQPNFERGRLSEYGGYLYFPCTRRVYRIKMEGTPEWEVFAKTPATQPRPFSSWIAVNSNGDMFTFLRPFPYLAQSWKSGEFDSPRDIGQTIPTGLSQRYYDGIGNESFVFVDDSDNLIVVTDNSKIFIYNPNGVVGFEKAKGTVVKL